MNESPVRVKSVSDERSTLSRCPLPDPRQEAIPRPVMSFEEPFDQFRDPREGREDRKAEPEAESGSDVGRELGKRDLLHALRHDGR